MNPTIDNDTLYKEMAGENNQPSEKKKLRQKVAPIRLPVPTSSETFAAGSLQFIDSIGESTEKYEKQLPWLNVIRILLVRNQRVLCQ